MIAWVPGLMLLVFGEGLRVWGVFLGGLRGSRWTRSWHEGPALDILFLYLSCCNITMSDFLDAVRLPLSL